MVEEFEKGHSVQLSDNFWSIDFDCHCQYQDCSHTLIDSDLIEGLDLLWERVGPIRVKWPTGGSAYRCSRHNKDIGGKPGSIHMLGKAADIKSQSVSIATLCFAADSIGLFKSGGIGRYATFVHLDVRGYPARWSG